MINYFKIYKIVFVITGFIFFIFFTNTVKAGNTNPGTTDIVITQQFNVPVIPPGATTVGLPANMSSTVSNNFNFGGTPLPLSNTLSISDSKGVANITNPYSTTNLASMGGASNAGSTVSLNIPGAADYRPVSGPDGTVLTSVTVSGMGRSGAVNLTYPATVIGGKISINTLDCENCTVTYNFEPPDSAIDSTPSFSGYLSIDPYTRTVAKGSSTAYYTAKFHSYGSWTGTVNFSVVSGCPVGSTCTFPGPSSGDVSAASPDVSVTIKVSTTPATPIGTYPFIVDVNSTYTDTATLYVTDGVADPAQTNKAKFIDQQYDLGLGAGWQELSTSSPPTLNPGQVVKIKMYMKNEGTKSWYKNVGGSTCPSTDGYYLHNKDNSATWGVTYAGANTVVGGYKVEVLDNPVGAIPSYQYYIINTKSDGYDSADFGIRDIKAINTSGDEVIPVSINGYTGDTYGDADFSVPPSYSTTFSSTIDWVSGFDVNSSAHASGGAVVVDFGAPVSLSSFYIYPTLPRGLSGYRTEQIVGSPPGDLYPAPGLGEWGKFNAFTFSLKGSNVPPGLPTDGTLIKDFRSYQPGFLTPSGGYETSFPYPDSYIPANVSDSGPGWPAVTHGYINAPGNQQRYLSFIYNITAPLAGGTYPFQWRMYQDCVTPTGFDESSPLTQIPVAGGVAPTVDMEVSNDNATWSKSVSVFKDQNIYVKWTLGNAPTSCTATGTWNPPGTRPPIDGTEDRTADSGSTGTKTYTLSCIASGITVSDTVTAKVNAPVPFCGDLTTIGVNQMVGCVWRWSGGGTFNTDLSNSTNFSTNYTLDSNAPRSPVLASPAPVNASVMDQNWGSGGPNGLTDKFVVKWVGKFNFPAGTYVFTTGSDDGAMLYLDATSTTPAIVDDWSDTAAYKTKNSSTITLTAGTHTLEYWYYENTGLSRASLSWAAPSPDPSNIAGGGSPCPLSLTWTAASGSPQYNIYRNTVNNVGTATLVQSNLTGTSFTDASAVVGTAYYYWVQAVGSATKVAATNNATGGVTAGGCPPNPANPVSATNAGAACTTVKISWTDNSSNETGFKIYKDGAGPIYTAAANATTYTYTPGDISPHIYSVAATNAAGDSAQFSSGSVAAISCAGDLTAKSDKDITQIGSGSPLTPSTCNNTSDLPPNTSAKLGDTIKFSINLCNIGTNTSTNITIVDSLFNLTPVAASYRYCNGATCTAVTPTITGTVPKQVLTFNLTATQYDVPSGAPATPTVRNLTFSAKVDGGPGFTATYGHFINQSSICYKRFPGDSACGGSKEADTPSVLFSNLKNTPNRQEVAP